MPFTPKDWKNGPSGATPIDDLALEDLEMRVTGYVDSQIALDVAGMPMPTTGEETINRQVAVGTSTQASGQMRITYFRARRTESITKLLLTGASPAAGATPTLVRAGIYSVNEADWSLTALVASIANDTTIFATANTEYLRALTSTFNKVAGTYYAFAQLVVTTAAAPGILIMAIPANAPTSIGGNGRPRLSAQLAGLSDLPASVAAGSLVLSNNQVYGFLVP